MLIPTGCYQGRYNYIPNELVLSCVHRPWLDAAALSYSLGFLIINIYIYVWIYKYSSQELNSVDAFMRSNLFEISLRPSARRCARFMLLKALVLGVCFVAVWISRPSVRCAWDVYF